MPREPHLAHIHVITNPNILLQRVGFDAAVRAIADSWRCERALRQLREEQPHDHP